MNMSSITGQRKTRVLFSFLIASVMLVLVFQTLYAQEQELLPPDLTGLCLGPIHSQILCQC